MSATAAAYSSPERDLADAGGDAPLDVVLEAGPAPLAVDRLVAGSNTEQPMGQTARPAREGCRQKRTRIDVAVARVDAAGDKHPRKPLAGGHLQMRIVLVVAEEDVVQGAFCLMRWFSSASASTTESVTMTSS